MPWDLNGVVAGPFGLDVCRENFCQRAGFGMALLVPVRGYVCGMVPVVLEAFKPVAFNPVDETAGPNLGGRNPAFTLEEGRGSDKPPDSCQFR